MAFITRCLPIALSLLLTACPDSRGSSIRSILREGDALSIDLDLRFSATQLQALEHGIPLQLALYLDTQSAPAIIELHFSPLARQYELRLPGGRGTRVFASRARLLAALDRILLEDVQTPRGSAHIALVSSALPAPLRLPALIDREWQLATPALAWGD